ncbi:hypothetical protein BD410DRAFT_732690, partial [Rickenella mellea]
AAECSKAQCGSPPAIDPLWSKEDALIDFLMFLTKYKSMTFFSSTSDRYLSALIIQVTALLSLAITPRRYPFQCSGVAEFVFKTQYLAKHVCVRHSIPLRVFNEINLYSEWHWQHASTLARSSLNYYTGSRR